ncbi:MAG TPA: lysophospholipid acyltransferase family protein [Gammaproteobacteria bacterium]
MFTCILEFGGLWARRTILGMLHLMGSVLGHFLYAFRCCRYYYSHTNINLCFPAFSAREINRLTKLSLRETGKLLFEVMFFWMCPGTFYRHSIRKVIGEEHLLKARAEGCGVILVSPHLGNWEVFNAWAGKYDACVSYKPLACRWLNRWIRRCRQCNGSKLFPINSEGLKVLCAELDKGGVVVLFPDQVPTSTGRIMAPFFKVPAWSGTFVSRLANKRNVRVICGSACRLPGAQGFEIYLQPAPEEIYLRDPGQSVAALNRGMEDCIRRRPEQYTWEYKRFKNGVYKQLYYKTTILS